MQVWLCNLCSSEGDGINSLTNHAIANHSQLSNRCNCGRRFNDNNELMHHVVDRHISTRYTCNHCMTKFNHEITMQIHLEKHRQKSSIDSEKQKSTEAKTSYLNQGA